MSLSADLATIEEVITKSDRLDITGVIVAQAEVEDTVAATGLII